MATDNPKPPMPGLEPRVAVLETDVTNIKEMLAGVRTEMRDLRTDMNAAFRDIRKDMRGDFRWLLTLYLGGMGTIIAGGGFMLAKIAVKVGAF
jgi:hypothetical protein